MPFQINVIEKICRCIKGLVSWGKYNNNKTYALGLQSMNIEPNAIKHWKQIRVIIRLRLRMSDPPNLARQEPLNNIGVVLKILKIWIIVL